jgi:hypothetical protein
MLQLKLAQNKQKKLQSINSNLRYKSGRLLVTTVRVRHYGRGDVRSRVKDV